MRSIITVLLLLLIPALLAGCTSSSNGTFGLHVTDAPDNIGDFASLTVNVDKITLTTNDGKTHDYTPASPTFDLTKLTSGNLTTLFNGSVATGNYTKLELHITAATGVLRATNASVSVKTPSDRIFLDTSFEVAAGKETDFVFDIQVHQEGNGDYIFKPNATGSGPKTPDQVNAQKAAHAAGKPT